MKVSIRYRNNVRDNRNREMPSNSSFIMEDDSVEYIFAMLIRCHKRFCSYNMAILVKLEAHAMLFFSRFTMLKF